ncbi:MAG: FAD-binding domain-containing protein [Alphaproteobacteria bacterium]|nr:FAD-binding domain-containing protein [Alphaproteobacteria bacterium]
MTDPLSGPLWRPDRRAAEARLAAFLPSAGRAYAARRNYDLGPQDRDNVSALSPWVRHRAVTEEEIAAQVLQRHSLSAAEKFIQEVVWRTYWKGWLEHRPAVWRDYLAALGRSKAALADDRSLRQRYEAAIDGRTGIDCFDAWADELIEHGWLHNHARIWFASIWIFTLDLPWELGADFFYTHLLDGDTASNTLSWRWVAGLQTIGKTYLARPDNIARYTEGRFHPVGQLAPAAPPLAGDAHPAPAPPTPPDLVTPSGDLFDRIPPKLGRVGLLATAEDLSPADHVQGVEVAATAILSPPQDPAYSAGRRTFLDGLLADAAARMADRFGGVSEKPGSSAEVVDWARDLGVDKVLTPFAPTGPTADSLMEIKEALRAAGVALVISQRRWDQLFYPHSQKGFFKMKAQIPKALGALGLTR